MALSPPTVASDPGTAGQLNTAFGIINGFIANGVAEALVGIRAAADLVRIHSGNQDIMDKVAGRLGVLAGLAEPDPAVISNSQANTNAALATMAAIGDLLNSRLLGAIEEFRPFLALADGQVGRLIVADDSQANLGSPALLTALTVASDPGTKAQDDAALAATTGYVDNANAEIAAALQNILNAMSMKSSNAQALGDLQTSIDNLSNP
jgi:hypothetical protein